MDDQNRQQPVGDQGGTQPGVQTPPPTQGNDVPMHEPSTPVTETPVREPVRTPEPTPTPTPEPEPAPGEPQTPPASGTDQQVG